jgi:hypothetical protein
MGRSCSAHQALKQLKVVHFEFINIVSHSVLQIIQTFKALLRCEKPPEEVLVDIMLNAIIPMKN